MPRRRSSATATDTLWLSEKVAGRVCRYFVTKLIKSKTIVNIDTFHLSGRECLLQDEIFTVFRYRSPS